MTLDRIAKNLHKEINFRMNEFCKLGNEAQELLKKNGDPDKILELECAMAHIFASLKPVEEIVRATWPEYNELFDALEHLKELRLMVIDDPAQA